MLKSPFREPRGFKGRAERVLLPDLMLDMLAPLLAGLGERRRNEAPNADDGSFEEDAPETDDVLSDFRFATLRRLSGVLI